MNYPQYSLAWLAWLVAFVAATLAFARIEPWHMVFFVAIPCGAWVGARIASWAFAARPLVGFLAPIASAGAFIALDGLHLRNNCMHTLADVPYAAISSILFGCLMAFAAAGIGYAVLSRKELRQLRGIRQFGFSAAGPIILAASMVARFWLAHPGAVPWSVGLLTFLFGALIGWAKPARVHWRVGNTATNSLLT